MTLGLAVLGGCPAPPIGDRADIGFNVADDAAAANDAPGTAGGATTDATGGEPTFSVSGEPVFSSAPIFQAIPGKTGSHAPTVAALPDGSLLAAWYSYDGPHELQGAAIYLTRLSAGGASVGSAANAWAEPAPLVDRSVDVGNPVLYAEGQRVWLFYAVVPGGWSTSHIEVQRSNDGGLTWTPPDVLDSRLGSNVRFPPVRLDDGTLLLPAYDDLLQRSLFYASPDGAGWTLRSELITAAPSTSIQPSIAVLADGRILAVMRNGDGQWLWVSASDDGGRSWLPAADSGFPNPASPAAVLRLASGHLLLVFNDSPTARRPLSVALSPDEGRSWTTPRVIADGEGDYAYPAAVQTPDGMVHVVYSHDRAWIQHVAFNEAWAAGG